MLQKPERHPESQQPPRKLRQALCTYIQSLYLQVLTAVGKGKDNLSLRWPQWGSFDMPQFVFVCALLQKANCKTNQKLGSHLVESVKSSTFGEEPATPEVLWASFGLFVAVAFGIFAHNGPCTNWKWKITDKWIHKL